MCAQIPAPCYQHRVTACFSVLLELQHKSQGPAHTHTQDRGTLFIGSTLHSLNSQTVRPTDVPSEANGQQGTTGVPHSKNYPLHHSDHSAFTNHLHVHTPDHLLWSVFALLEARLEGVQLLPERKNLLFLV